MSASPETPDLDRLLPHRPPFRCLDRQVSADAAHAVAEWQVVAGPFLAGEEAWEGALIEGLAQTAALLRAASAADAGAGVNPAKAPASGLLVGVRGLEVRRRPRAGERVRYRVDLVRRLPPLVLVRGEAHVDDEVLAAGELKFYEEPGPGGDP